MSEVKAHRRPGRPSAKGSDVPDQSSILAAGLRAFAEFGYEETTVRELAIRLGVSHNFINDRFGSKEKFWQEVVDAAHSPMIDTERAALTSSSDGAEQIARAVHALARHTLAEPDLTRVLDYEARRNSDRLRYVYSKHIAPFVEELRPTIDKLVQSGVMRPFPLEAVVFSVITLTSFHSRQALAGLLGPSAERDPEAFVDSLGEIVLRGILIGSGDPAAGRPRRDS